MKRDWSKSSALACRFCDIAAGHIDADHNRVVMESDDYFAVASVGGFIEGWTLVCTKAHALNLATDFRRAAFQEFAIEVSYVVTRAYGDVALFEHGVQAPGSLTGCGTDHAHLHIVPYQGSIVHTTVQFDPRREWIRVPSQEVERVSAGREYLLMADRVEALSDATHVSIVDQPQSQFFRHVLAKEAGVPGQADYRQFPYLDRTVRTSDRVASTALDCEVARI